jgi:hypothetical protein
MTPADYTVLGIAVSLVAILALVFLAGLGRHERREFARQDAHEQLAQAREDRAIERHDLQMRALADAQRGYLAAVNQRSRLEERVADLTTRVERLEST